MPKRNVVFAKPEEPSFLKRLKKEVGYQEGPSIDTKVNLYFITISIPLGSGRSYPTVIISASQVLPSLASGEI